ncbi:T9SS type A sorting domain-containing protein [bacterium]|nr:T9SS type A sorting domain-containing protein [bacterium]
MRRPYLLYTLVLCLAGSLAANPPQPPIFTGCPDMVTGNHCDSLLYSVVAIDPNAAQPGYSRNVRYHLVSGPGEINTKTGLWVWHPEPSDVYQNYQVEISASAHDTMTTGDQNCRFYVSAENNPPEMDAQRYQYVRTEVGQEAIAQFTAYDSDECDTVTYYLYDVEPFPVGSFSLDSNTGLFHFTPEASDNNRRFEFYIHVGDGLSGGSTAGVTVEVGTAPVAENLSFRIASVEFVPLGSTVDVPVWIDTNGYEFDRIELLIAYDSSLLHLEDVLEDDFLQSCGWELLDWWPYRIPLLPGEPSSLAGIFVRLAADIPYIDGEPTCLAPDVLPTRLLRLRFDVIADNSDIEATTDVRFYWPSCFANRTYSTSNKTLLASAVRDADGDLRPRPLELPSFDGLPTDCGISPYTAHVVTFRQGRLQLVDSNFIPLRGDCNMDGIAWTLEDLSYLGGYFYGGCPTAYCGCADPNLDSVPNHISDYWFMFNVVHYSRDPETPVPTLSDQVVTIFDDTLTHQIHIANTDSICGFFAVFDGIVEFPFMAYEYFHIWNDGNKTYALANLPVIIPDKATNYDYFLEDGVLFEYTGGTLLEIQASTCAGVRMPVMISVGPSPYQIVIETEAGPDSTGVTPGTFQHVDVKLTNALAPIGAFSLLMAYDASQLSFAGAEIDSSPLYTECAWEYFTFRTGANGNCEGDCPSGLVSVTGIAETNDGPHHPEICNLAEFDNPTIFTLEFLVSAHVAYERWSPIDFFWVDCTDNTMSNWIGDTLLMSNRVLRRTSYSWQNPDDESSWQDVTDYLAGFPTYTGAQAQCTINPDPNRPEPASLIEFIGGGIYVKSETTITLGDLNFDGFPFTVADGVIFANYFLWGRDAFSAVPDEIPFLWIQFASDMNIDSRFLTIEDFVLLVRTMNSGPFPLPPYTGPLPDPVSFVLSPEGVLSFAGPYNLGAVRIVFDGTCQVEDELASMDLAWRTDGDSTIALIYTYDTVGTGASGNLVRVTGDCATIRSVEAANFSGRAIQCVFDTPTDVGDPTSNLPEHFALEQNYPNPFNPTTTIEFAMPEAAHVSIEVYNIMGRRVRSLVTSYLPAGYHSIIWDGRDQSGAPVASGVYLYRIDAGTFIASRKMLLLK